MKRVMFICTGNYYRSRFAEEWFNHCARREPVLDWVVDSRGLALERGIWNIGPISQHARRALGLRGIELDATPRGPMPLRVSDLTDSDRVIALKEAEHRPLMNERFGEWADRIEYWHVHDLDASTPELAMDQLQGHVEALVASLRAEDARHRNTR